MAISVHFAHITDVHISDHAESWSTVTETAPRLLQESFENLNQIADLDFVFITGDVLDTGSKDEAERYNSIIAGLQKPWHFIPGNHDGYTDAEHPEALRPEEAIMLIDPRMGAERTPLAQRSYWSRPVKPGVQVIGLDSRLAEDWGGTVDPPQMEWLAQELETHQHDDLIILAVHHPLHPLGPHNLRGRFPKFICDNGAEVEALLDRYPNVKIVLSGHHHANHISPGYNSNHRLHVCTSALTGAQCSYRTIRMTQAPDGWHTKIRSHSTADAETMRLAAEIAMRDSMAREFNPEHPEAWLTFCAGRPEDVTFDGVVA